MWKRQRYVTAQLACWSLSEPVLHKISYISSRSKINSATIWQITSPPVLSYKCAHALRLPEAIRHVSVVDFFSISVVCVTFSSYLYEEKHSLQPSWIHSLLKFTEMLLSCCQLVGDDRSLDSLPLDSISSLWRPVSTRCTLLHCILQCVKTSTWWITVIYSKGNDVCYSFVPSSVRHLKRWFSTCFSLFLFASVCVLQVKKVSSRSQG